MDRMRGKFLCFSGLDTGLSIVYFFNYIEIDPRHKGQTVTQYSA